MGIRLSLQEAAWELEFPLEWKFDVRLDNFVYEASICSRSTSSVAAAAAQPARSLTTTLNDAIEQTVAE